MKRLFIVALIVMTSATSLADDRSHVRRSAVGAVLLSFGAAGMGFGLAGLRGVSEYRSQRREISRAAFSGDALILEAMIPDSGDVSGLELTVYQAMLLRTNSTVCNGDYFGIVGGAATCTRIRRRERMARIGFATGAILSVAGSILLVDGVRHARARRVRLEASPTSLALHVDW